MKRAVQYVVIFALAAFPMFTEASQHNKSKDIVDTAVSAGQFNILVTAVKAAGLVDTLKGDGPFTVFAPTDDAFAKLPDGTVETLLKPENKKKLQSILTYHVVSGKVMAKDVVELSGAQTVNGQRASVTVDGGKVMINDANVVKTDIKTSNGVIHVIDSVILPSDKNIVETAVEAGSFNTLAAALKAADLVDALQGEGPFTVFAPTDEAFAKLPEGTVESLLKPENKEKLQTILKLHVVSGRAFSEDVLEKGKFNSLAEIPLKAKVEDGDAFVNGSKIVKTDINATNGVIHVIDSVILPSDKYSSARNLIQTAIAHGAPLYNQGHAAACASVYAVAAQALMKMEISENAKQPLQLAMSKMRHSNNPNAQAWIMRHGLDNAFNELSH